MPIIQEKPRLPIENTAEQHLACAVLVDTSGSMSGCERELEEGIAAMKRMIIDDDIARGRVEICLIAFDDGVRELSPFSPIVKMEVPREIRCGGMTHTHEAVDFALRRLVERKEEYRNNGVSYYQPWIWLLTDGGSNDADNGSFQKLLDAQKRRRCVFCGIAIGNQVNETELASMNKDGMFLKIGKDNLAKAFEFIAKSLENGFSWPHGMPDVDGNLEVKHIDQNSSDESITAEKVNLPRPLGLKFLGIDAQPKSVKTKIISINNKLDSFVEKGLV